jgi:cell fate regulator YaaT (PSP1 superfamily)
MKELYMQHIAKTRIKVKMYRFLCPEHIKIKSGDKVKVQFADKEIDYGEVINLCPFHEKIHTDGAILETSTNISAQSQSDLILKDKEVLRYCQDKSQELKLNMILVKAEHVLDGSKIIIYFTSGKRIDFRELVKGLNNFLHHKTRVELWQISSREKAILIGGIGVCGREVCCRCIGKIPDTVGIRTVKEQCLEINPIKITGICGKLMCCLTYEHDQYKQMRKEFPEINSTVTMGDKKGTIHNINYISQKMKIRFEDGITREITLNEYLGKEPSPLTDVESKEEAKIHIVKPRTIKDRVKKVFKSRSNRTEDKPVEPPAKENPPPAKKSSKPSPEKTTDKPQNKPPKNKPPGFSKPWRKRRFPRKNKNEESSGGEKKKP